jgi:heavy metal sensor kinase
MLRSLSTRMTVFSGLLTTGLLGIFGISVLLFYGEGLEEQLDSDLAKESRSLLARMRSELETHPDGFRSPFIRDLVRSLEATGSLAQVTAPDGTELFGSSDFPTSLEGYQGRVDHLPAGVSGAYTLELARATSPSLSRVRKLAILLVVFIPIAVIFAILLSQFAIRRTLAPLEAIRLQAEQISRTNLSERIPEMGSSQELQDLVRTFNAMLGRLEKAIVDLDSFAADAAHELRTPLATLRAEIETAIRSNPTIPEYEDILSSFQIEVSRMSRVVTDLFTLAKLDMHQHALQKEPVRLGPLLEDSRETWQPLASMRNIQIELQGGDAEVLGDPAALGRVFMNLVENAVKYNREGGRVQVSLERRNGTVHVEVSDTGQGIAPEHLPRLFRRFFRADQGRSRERGGAGLGLAICKSFVESHAGKISVSSTLGQGSTFRIELPAKTD